MISFSKEKMIEMHYDTMEKMGDIENAGVKNMGALESTVDGINAEYFGTVLRPTIESKAAWILFNINKCHVFQNGNKRTSSQLMVNFLRSNGVDIEYTKQEIIDMVVGVAASNLNEQDVIKWIEEHRVDLPPIGPGGPEGERKDPTWDGLRDEGQSKTESAPSLSHVTSQLERDAVSTEVGNSGPDVSGVSAPVGPVSSGGGPGVN